MNLEKTNQQNVGDCRLEQRQNQPGVGPSGKEAHGLYITLVEGGHTSIGEKETKTEPEKQHVLARRVIVSQFSLGERSLFTLPISILANL